MKKCFNLGWASPTKRSGILVREAAELPEGDRIELCRKILGTVSSPILHADVDALANEAGLKAHNLAREYLT